MRRAATIGRCPLAAVAVFLVVLAAPRPASAQWWPPYWWPIENWFLCDNICNYGGGCSQVCSFNGGWTTCQEFAFWAGACYACPAVCEQCSDYGRCMPTDSCSKQCYSWDMQSSSCGEYTQWQACGLRSCVVECPTASCDQKCVGNGGPFDVTTCYAFTGGACNY